MIDTVTLYRLGSTFKFNSNSFKTNLDVNGDVVTHYNIFYDTEGKKPIYIENNLKLNYLKMQFSAPKLVYGTNTVNLDLKHTDNIQNILHDRLANIYEDDYSTMQLSRIDISKNIEVVESPAIYIHCLHDRYLKQGRYREEKFSDESIVIKNNSRRFMFYDKIREAVATKDISPRQAKHYPNLLRYEIQHSKARNIKTSLGRTYQFSDIMNEGFFEQCRLFQLKSFDKLFMNYGRYELFVTDKGLIDLITGYSKRNLLKNFIIRSLTESEDYHHDFTKYSDLLQMAGMKRAGITKALKELRQLLSLSRKQTGDILNEVRMKLVS